MTKTDSEKGKKDWFTKIMIIQLVVCALAAGILFIAVKASESAASSVKGDYLSFMSGDFTGEDLSDAFKSVKEYAAAFSEKKSDTADEKNADSFATVAEANSENETSVVGGGADIEFSSLDALEGISLKKTEIGFSMITPLDSYTVTSRFGYRISPVSGEAGLHTGIDLACSYASPIFAAADGVVEDAAFDASYGNYIKLSHGDGVVSIYAHCSALCVDENETVRAGDKIAEAGSTGSSTGNHLHFEVRKDNIRINPEYLLDL